MALGDLLDNMGAGVDAALARNQQMQQQAQQRPHGWGGGVGGGGIRDFLGRFADALLVARGGKPLYSEHMKESRRNSALQRFLGEIDPEMATMIGEGVDPSDAVSLYKVKHPTDKEPSIIQEWRARNALPESERGDFDGYVKSRQFNPYAAPIQMGPNDTLETPEQPSEADALPTVADQASYDAVPPGGRYKSPDGHIRQKPGGPTESPSGGFSVTSRNNNPGALRVPGSMQFQRFASVADGVKAQEAQLHRYHQRGLKTVSSVVETYAPRKSRGGDNTDEQVNNYIAYVAKRIGVNPQDTLSPAVLPRLAQAMREFETGERAN